ncbi:phospholipid-translocating p-type flippase family protein, putative [Ichthyophthirius multifiliis]|uniref:Vacuolar protein sorting-associated protein 51 homolog n=1 Tax=Ichthyophthirius multifiliis TaxID=5932 RepID=G0QJR1_ICHMU|nr:phospholipid-translocating p-type flippase family protein, putative [Ichthyophthirius multifiliis]EGR34543.1 phospholipid-translocating p-type flippase family protein, putative [Ichthyophthirius multifiliis]|eukprot:XP_004039847.1 phospholipid-translocating p-type flippase family protein, putative [Ichthyophthirius multifiliis]
MVEIQKIDYKEIFSKSVENYKVCFKMLDDFKEEPLVAPIYKDSIGKIEEIRTILWNLQNLYKPQSFLLGLIKQKSGQVDQLNTQELKFITNKLVAFMQDQESVLRNYLKIAKDRFQQMASDIIENQVSLQVLGLKQNNNEDQQQQYELKNFYENLEYQTVKIQTDQEGTIIWLMNQLKVNLFEELKNEIQFLLKEISQILNPKFQKGDVISQTIKEIFMNLLQKTSEKISSKKITNLEVNQCFKVLNEFLNEQIFQNQFIDRNLKTELADKFFEQVENVCRSQVMNCFSNLRYDYMQLIIETKYQCKQIQDEYINDKSDHDLQEAESNLKREIFQLTTILKNKLDSLIQCVSLELKSFVFSEDQYLKNHDMFIGLMHGQMVDFCKIIHKTLGMRQNQVSIDNVNLYNSVPANRTQMNKLNNQFIALFQRFQQSPENNVYFLLVNQFLQIYEKKIISQIFDTLNTIIDFYQNLKSTTLNQDIQKIQNGAKYDFSINYVNYCQSSSEEILGSLDSYFEDNKFIQNTQPPSDISPEINNIVNYIRTIILELNIFFPDMKRSLVKKTSFVKLDGTFNIEMERMLVKKSHQFDTNRLEFNRNLLLMSLLKGIFKGIIERVRQVKIFDNFSFQQLQIDLCFIMQLFFEMVAVDDESFITALYFEIIESASDNYLDNKKLDQQIIDNIVQQKRQKLKI